MFAPPVLFAVAAVVFLATRFEAMVYYAALLAPLLYRRRWRTFLGLAVLGLTIAGIMEIARLAIFADYLPNTIHAKGHAPYSHTGFAALHSRFRGGLEVVASLFPLVFASLAALLFSPSARRDTVVALRHPLQVPDVVVILLAPIVAVGVFCTAIGKTWGYTGRMEFLALPCGLLLAGLLFDRYFAQKTRWSLAVQRALLAVLVLAILAFSWHQSARHVIGIAQHTMAGKSYHAVPDVNPVTYRKNALAVRKVAALAGLREITFMTPDVGGVGLCCREIRVVDIGLLTDRDLGRDGYRAFPQVLAREKPEVIGTHLMWATLSGIYEMPAFLSGYQPALVDNTRLYVRKDVVAAMARRGALSFCSVADEQCRRRATRLHRYAATIEPRDDHAFLRAGTVLIVD